MPIGSIGPRIRRARKDAGLSGVALAKLIDKSQPYVSDLERGERTPSLETLVSLASALNRPMSYFFGEEEKGGTRELLDVTVASPENDGRSILAMLVAEQLAALPALQGERAPSKEQMVRIVEQAIDNAYHQLLRALRERRRAREQAQVG